MAHYRWLLMFYVVVSTTLVQAKDNDRWVVHEWGTFTTLQDDRGQELYGINIDDEPVPSFVHNLEPYLLEKAVLSNEYWLSRQKGTPRHHPQVSMRLETPVIYFHPPQNAKVPTKFDVRVKFQGGWLTEFYPWANVGLPLDGQGFDFSHLSPDTVSELHWKELQVGTSGKGPDTNDKVWLAPRSVAAESVTNEMGESEKYLFYRGVAQLHAPLRAATRNKGEALEIYSNCAASLAANETSQVSSLWLMEAKADGRCAYRALDALAASADEEAVVVTMPRRFAAADFTAENRARLEEAMHAALVKDGLYPDEATALLSTWQRAYFRSPGLRLFYLVPHAWTDHYLPLTISGEPDITRVMIGRIELVSDTQQITLEKLAKADGIGPQWLANVDTNSEAWRKFSEGRSDFGNLGVEIPPHFQLYLELGRFRNALVAAESTRRGPRNNFTKLINAYQLAPFQTGE